MDYCVLNSRDFCVDNSYDCGIILFILVYDCGIILFILVYLKYETKVVIENFTGTKSQRKILLRL